MAWFQSLQADNLDAINRFVVGTVIKTPAAQQLRDEWIQWFDTRTSYDLNFDRPTYDAARNRKLAFELANATSDAEREQIKLVAQTGMSSEEMQGEADRRQTGGHYTEASPASPFVGLAWLAVAIGGAAAAGAFLARR
jgi:hypothetical protein